MALPRANRGNVGHLRCSWRLRSGAGFWRYGVESTPNIRLLSDFVLCTVQRCSARFETKGQFVAERRDRSSNRPRVSKGLRIRILVF